MLLKAGGKVKPSEFGLSAATPRVAELARDQAEAELRRLGDQAGAFASAASRRLSLALGLFAGRCGRRPRRRGHAPAVRRPAHFIPAWHTSPST